MVSDYATWVDWLGRFGRGEVDALDGLPAMSGEELGGPTAERFAGHCLDALQARLKTWERAFSRDRAAARGLEQVRLAHRDARARLAPIRHFTESPLIFEPLRQGLTDDFQSVVQKLQDELSQQAQHAPLDVRESTVRLVRELPLTAAVEGHGAPVPTSDYDSLAPRSGPRKIMIAGRSARG